MNRKLTFLICISIGFSLGYYYHKSKISEDKYALVHKANSLLENKSAISDGQFQYVNGVTINQTFSLSSIGFQIYKLEKTNGGYLKTTFVPGNLLKKQPFSSGIENLYREVYIDLLSNSQIFSTSFTPGSFKNISKFPDLNFYEHRYHSMENTKNPVLLSADKISKIPIERDKYILNCEQAETFYKIVENHDEVVRSLQSTLLISGLISSSLWFAYFTILDILKRQKSNKKKSLTNKRWRNTEDKSIITLKTKPLNKSATLIRGDKAFRGQFKFLKLKKELHLFFPNKEYLYKVISIEEDLLVLQDLATMKVQEFENIDNNTNNKHN